MKPYATLLCSVCKRTKDSLINKTHYIPDQCTITFGCEGRLSPIGFSGSGTAGLGIPPIGSANWRARGTQLASDQITTDAVLLGTGTGPKDQCILAVSNTNLGYAPGNQAVLTLNLVSEQLTAQDFRQYTYRRGASVLVLNGIEDAAAKKVLRYDMSGATPDRVDVLVNGIKLSRGTAAGQYQVYQGVPGSVPPNSVQFNTPVSGASTQIDVVVTKAPIVTAVTLVFSRMIHDESRTGTWEGVSTVHSPQLGNFSLFYCDFREQADAINLNVKLSLNAALPAFVVQAPGSAANLLPPKSIFMLFSKSAANMPVDRERSTVIWTDSLISGTEYLVVKLTDGVRKLFVTQTSEKIIFPALEL